MYVYRTFVLLIFSYGCKTKTWTEVRMGRLQVTYSNCLRRIVGVKLIATSLRLNMNNVARPRWS
eukprot:353338-Chlamydomonas_euryale.AAC.4